MKFTNTIKKNREFVRVYKKGRYYVGKLLILYVLKGGISGIAARRGGESAYRANAGGGARASGSNDAYANSGSESANCGCGGSESANRNGSASGGGIRANSGANAILPIMNSLGITASKKVGKSVRRNRLKRLVKENYRNLEPSLRRGRAMVFVIRAPEKMPLYADIQDDMISLMKRAGMLCPTP
jgi:RNase P protein component